MTINKHKINKSILIFFKFVYQCLLLYSRCYLYPWAGIVMFHSTQLVAIPHRLNFGKVSDTAPALFFRRQKLAYLAVFKRKLVSYKCECI